MKKSRFGNTAHADSEGYGRDFPPEVEISAACQRDFPLQSRMVLLGRAGLLGLTERLAAQRPGWLVRQLVSGGDPRSLQLFFLRLGVAFGPGPASFLAPALFAGGCQQPGPGARLGARAVAARRLKSRHTPSAMQAGPALIPASAPP